MTGHPSMWNSLASTPISISFRDILGIRTRVLEAGEGEPLILLHGIGGHLEAYTRNIPVLSEHFRVIAFDMPGHGFSSGATKDQELGDYTDHLAALLDAFEIDRAYLNGESLGGWVSMKFACAYPDRTGKVVLNTPGGTAARPEVMERLRMLSQHAADDPTPERIRARLEWLMADKASVTDELVEARQRIYAQPHFAESMRHLMCLQDPVVRKRNMVTDEELSAIRSPALVVWTSNDPSGPAAQGMHIAETIPGGRFHFIDGAGHWPQWEQAEEFNKAVSAFLIEPN
jgi:2-hydroxy-6-oxonona-2,4-dienedioate hydrolase